MMLPRVIFDWLGEIRKPSYPGSAIANRTRRSMLPYLSHAVAFRLDDETVRACQSVGPKLTENGLEVFRRWRSPAPILWVEFNAEVVMNELRQAGVEIAKPFSSPELAAQLDRREFGYLIDSRFEDGISVWLIKDRGKFIFGPPIEMFIPYEEDGLLSDRCELYGTGYLENDLSEAEFENEKENIIFALDVPVIFCALLRAKAPVFEVEEAKLGAARSRIRQDAVKIGEAGKVRLPPTHVIRLSEMGRLHNAALDLDLEGETGDGPRSSGSARRSPRRHLVRGHTFVRAGSVFWRNPHVRGGANATPTLVRNDVPDQRPRLELADPDPEP